MVVAAYFRVAKKFLRESLPKEQRLEYYRILDAGFILVTRVCA